MPSKIDPQPAAHQLSTLLDRVTDDQLALPTPCPAYTVADLLDHLMGLTIAFRDAGAKQLGETTNQPPSPSAAALDPDWRTQLPRRLDDLVDAWRTPGAWEGETQAGGVTMPAELMGLIAIDEIVLHGWDLARATGQPFDCDPVIAEALAGLLSEFDPNGTEGMFGPAVEPSPDATTLEQVVARSGRDPGWRPA